MWTGLIQNLTSKHEFFSPTNREEILKAEQLLGVLLPDELKDLLKESNGVYSEYGLGLIWPLERIIKDNLDFRQTPDFKDLYMPFEPLLFFADAGNGDQFAFVILDGEVRQTDIFVWNHENDSRSWAAPSLQMYLDWWLSGKLNI